uniref:Uncharacterized protein n=1 Tax=Nelumbo nucifera TaxID=4432 RepID=A0A822YL58_NELNU|nr:TPA_asm: hypothetical protein HUJ06_012103 [Nelumbo nucifera]
MPTIVSKNPQLVAESPQKTENRSSDLPNTCHRTSTRWKPVKDQDVLIENEPPSSLLLPGEAKIRTFCPAKAFFSIRQEQRMKTFFSRYAKKTKPFSVREGKISKEDGNNFARYRKFLRPIIYRVNSPLVTQQSSQQQQFSSTTTSTSTVMTTTGSNSNMRTKEADSMISSPMPQLVPNPSSVNYPSGGSFLPSLAALQSFNQPMNIGGDFGGSNLALLQGFSLPSEKNTIQRTIHQLLPSEENAVQQTRRSVAADHLSEVPPLFTEGDDEQ